MVRVSGTIRKAEEEAIRRAREEIRTARRLEGAGGDGGGLDRWFGGEEDAASGGKKVGEEWDGRSDDGSSNEEMDVNG